MALVTRYRSGDASKALVLGLVTASGCASIVSGRHAEVAINSYPPDAEVQVRDEQGRTVAAARTPAVVSLKRGNGFLKKAEYTVDPYTGAMWQPTPKAINEQLQPSSRPGPEIYSASHAAD
jgi:hypothetical protein